MAKTYALTGSASGIGAATRERLLSDGHRVIGVDVQQADIVADLATPDGRRAAVDGIRERTGGSLDGFVPFAGLSGLPNRAGSLVVSLNYFGAVEMLEALRPLLAAADAPAAVAVSSNSTSVAPGLPLELVEACNAGDEETARKVGDEVGSIRAYPATKMALARWVRRNAVGADWAGAGITLNAVAPGFTQTAMTDEGLADPIIGPHMSNFPVPIGRAGQPSEIASLFVFLLGPEARFCCGSVLYVDGGTDALLRPDDWPAPI